MILRNTFAFETTLVLNTGANSTVALLMFFLIVFVFFPLVHERIFCTAVTTLFEIHPTSKRETHFRYYSFKRVMQIDLSIFLKNEGLIQRVVSA